MKQSYLHLIILLFSKIKAHKNSFRSEFRKRTISGAINHRSKRSIQSTNLDIDLEFNSLTKIQEFTATTAIKEHSLNATGSERSFEYMRQMLVAMACYDYFVSNPGATKCWLKQVDFLRALRDYGCNCYPSNYDSFYGRDPNVVLWQLGLNGKGIDAES